MSVQPIIAAIRATFPNATRFGVSSADQGPYGYVLTDITLSTGETIDSGEAFDELDRGTVGDLLRDLDWGTFGDSNRDATFDVELSSGRMV